MSVQAYKFAVDYDSESDTLLLSSRRKVDESIEIADDMVIDLDSRGIIAGLELMYVSGFFAAAGTPLSPALLSEASTATVKATQYRNYLFLTICLPIAGKIVEEKLPPISLENFESPLVASV